MKINIMRFLGFSVIDSKIVGCYFSERVKVQRGIKGKTRSKVDEILIVGVPLHYLSKYVCGKKILFRSFGLLLKYRKVKNELY